MVLEEATAPAPEAFTDEPYPSDNDPYAGSQPQTSQAGPIDVDMSKLPGPIPIVGPMLGYSRARIAMDIKEHISLATQILKRPLNKGEVDAIAYNTANAKSLASYGCATGAALGAYQCYRTRETFRFPFFTPPADKFNPEIFGPLRGQTARQAWHVLRAGPYVLLVSLVGAFATNNYGALKAAVSMSQDPRLKDFNEELRRRVQERGGRIITQRPPPSSPRTPTEGRAPAGGAAIPGGKSAYGDEDDMSPTGGAYNYDLSGDPNSTTDTGILSDSQMRGQEVRQRADPRRSPTEDRGATFQMDKVTSQPSNYEDASGSGSQPARSSGGGSAWDRVRQQAGRGDVSRGSPRYPTPSNAGSGIQLEQREGSTTGDSFTFSSADEDRQLAKAEAQKEFDARIERERRGGDFGDSSKRW